MFRFSGSRRLRAAEGGAWPQADGAKDHCCRAKPGESGLQHVCADECSEQQPIRADEPAENKACEHHGAGKGHDSAIDIHFGSPSRFAAIVCLVMKGTFASMPANCAVRRVAGPRSIIVDNIFVFSYIRKYENKSQ